METPVRSSFSFLLFRCSSLLFLEPARKENHQHVSVLPRPRRERAPVRRSRPPGHQRAVCRADARASRTPSLGVDILAESPTGSGKTLAFGFRSSSAPPAPSASPAALVLVPTRELALQVTADLRPLASAKRLRITTVYGGAAHRPAGQAGEPGRHHRRDAGPAPRPHRAPLGVAHRRPHPRPRRGRPDARHGLQAPGRPHPAHRPRPTGRRCSSRPRSTAPSRSSPAPTRSRPPT